MNFARAAHQHVITPTAMSRTVKALEAQLGIRLFNRTTRSVSLTEAGAQLLATLAPALAQIRQSIEDVGESSSQPRGALRINTLDWEFVAGARPMQIDVQGHLIDSEMRCALTAARQGNGLAYVFRQFAEAELASGKLVTALDRHCAPGESFHLYYPHRAQMPGKLRAFIEFLRALNWEA